MAPDLKDLMQRNKMDWRKAGIAILGGTAILAVIFVLMPKPEQEVVVEEVAPAPVIDPFKDIRIEGQAAIVYDLTNEQVLYAKNVDAQLPLASLTKLITVYAALETMPASAPVTISEGAIATEGESGVSLGETFTLTNAAKLALVASSNDVSEAISETVQQMRSQSARTQSASVAQALGLTQTYALNGTGLDESLSTSGGYGSARDIAKLAGALAKKAPEIAESTTHSSVTVTSTAGYVHTLPNTNQGIRQVPGALLSKTGFTDLAGGNLVVVYDAGIDHPIAVVVLGSSVEGRFSDVRRLTGATMIHFSNL